MSFHGSVHVARVHGCPFFCHKMGAEMGAVPNRGFWSRNALFTRNPVISTSEIRTIVLQSVMSAPISAPIVRPHFYSIICGNSFHWNQKSCSYVVQIVLRTPSNIGGSLSQKWAIFETQKQIWDPFWLVWPHFGCNFDSMGHFHTYIDV